MLISFDLLNKYNDRNQLEKLIKLINSKECKEFEKVTYAITKDSNLPELRKIINSYLDYVDKSENELNEKDPGADIYLSHPLRSNINSALMLIRTLEILKS